MQRMFVLLLAILFPLMLETETDQAKIDENADASKKRVIGGGSATSIGVVSDVLINGKSNK